MSDTSGAAPIEPTAYDASAPAPAPAPGVAPVAPEPVVSADAVYAPPPAMAPPAAAVPAPVPPANLAVGIAMGTLFGLIAAIVYAVVTILIDREFAALALLVGFAIAYGFHRFGKTRGVVPGIIAAVIALVMFFLAIFIETAGAYAKYAGVSFIDGMRAAVQSPDLVISGYFSDGLSYLFALLTVVYAFYYANGGRSAKAQSAPAAAPAAETATEVKPEA